MGTCVPQNSHCDVIHYCGCGLIAMYLKLCMQVVDTYMYIKDTLGPGILSFIIYRGCPLFGGSKCTCIVKIIMFFIWDH